MHSSDGDGTNALGLGWELTRDESRRGKGRFDGPPLAQRVLWSRQLSVRLARQGVSSTSL